MGLIPFFGIFDNPKVRTKMKQHYSYPSLPQAWGIFGIFIAASIGLGLIIGVVYELTGAENMSPGNLLGYTISMLFVIWFSWRNKAGKSAVKMLYFKQAPSILYPLLIVFTLAFSVFLDPLTTLIPMPDLFKEIFAMLATKDIYTLLMVCLIGPVLEEVLFRGIILEGFLNRYKAGKAIFWSAFLFGLFHMNPWQFIPGFLIGILLAYIYMKTRSLIPVILIHIVNNSFSYILMYIYGADIMTFRELFSETEDYFAFYSLASVLMLLSLFFVTRILKPFQQFHPMEDKT